MSLIASLRPPVPDLAEACLALDETAALAAARDGGLEADALTLYSNAKHALNAWCRRVATSPQWAGAGIPKLLHAAKLLLALSRRFIDMNTD